MYTATLPKPRDLVGTYRRFGTGGPVYKIVGLAGETKDGEPMMRIRALESGEEAEYRFSAALDDPKEG